MKDLQIQVEKFYENLAEVENHRYKSWEHCYLTFQTKFKQNQLTKDEIDFLALHLAFYLASWGMYRGSSFLLQKDYKVFIPIVELLYLHRSSFNEEVIQRLIQSSNADSIKDYVKRYFEFDSLLSTELDKIRKSADRDVVNQISYTLKTKIVLGTLGCVPAYDRYFIDGLRLNKDPKLILSYSKNGFEGILNFAAKQAQTIKEIQRTIQVKSTYVHYPVMKIVDMYFWQLGFEESERKLVIQDRGFNKLY